jgi:SET domain-containing protein
MNYIIKKSNIHGHGVIANKTIKKNTNIGVVITYKYLIPFRTNDLGYYLNHSFNCNCKLNLIGNNYCIISTKNIRKNDEITINYDDTPWFIAGSWSL